MTDLPAGSTEPQLLLGDMVALKGDPSMSGAVIEVLAGVPEPRYRVFLGGDQGRRTFFSSQLRRVEPVPTSAGASNLSLLDFQARLTALQLTEPSLSNLYSLHAARVNFVPYQFRPVLKFIRADRPRLLIADEVGVGKTIEAGLILREMQARQEINNVLIICPKPLVTESKWRNEMMRFDEHFEHVDGATLRHCILQTDLNGEWPQRYGKAIMPFSLFDERLLFGNEVKRGSRREIGLLNLEPPPKFDLVIVDEAHYLRNPNTKVHAGVRYFTENANAVLLMSATPIQLRSDELYVLLNLLRPDVVMDPDTFSHMAEPNGPIHAAVSAARRAEDGWIVEAHKGLLDAGETHWGAAVLVNNPEYKQTLGIVAKNDVSNDERLAFIRDSENLNSFANMINRTRRRDIGSYFTTRKPETVEVPFTPEQQQLHDQLLETQAAIFRARHGLRAVGFLMSTIRRQASSCLFALAPFIEEILSRHVSDEDWLQAASGFEEEDWADIDEAAYTSLGADIQQVLKLANELDKSHDPKLDALLKIVREKQQRPNNKVLVFSSFRHTLRYLKQHLMNAGVRVGLVQGDVADEERTSLRERFSLYSSDSQAIDVLLSSEVGCEGLDYQFCDTLVNFDLPWNPQKIEQRIGRIDRYGQQSEVVAIYNIVTPGTVDFDIYDRCLLRIGVFREALGGSEEILGDITRQLRAVSENLELNEEQRKERLQQIADNQIRIVQEQARLEERQAELFGIVLPPNHIENEVRDATSFWLSPAAIQNLIQRYLTSLVGGEEHIIGTQAVKTLRLSVEARNKLLEDHRSLGRKSVSPISRDWERWLKEGGQRLEITFDATAASNHRNVVFVTPIHPLAQQAAYGLIRQSSVPNVTELIDTKLYAVTADVPPGHYPFAVYQWKRRGFRGDSQLQPVSADPTVTARFFDLVATASGAPPGGLQETSSFPVIRDEADDDLESSHYELWRTARDEHREQTRQIAAFRRQSLEASHDARIKTLNEQIAHAENPRIRRMRQSQSAAAEADFNRRLAEITDAETKSDIVAEKIAGGVLVLLSASGQVN